MDTSTQKNHTEIVIHQEELGDILTILSALILASDNIADSTHHIQNSENGNRLDYIANKDLLKMTLFEKSK